MKGMVVSEGGSAASAQTKARSRLCPGAIVAVHDDAGLCLGMPIASIGGTPIARYVMKRHDDPQKHEVHRDPVTGAPGAHPLGVGLGAAVGGAAAGAALGTMAGPVGSVAGAVVGGVLGGLSGKAFAEKLDPTLQSEDAYWRDHYLYESYVDPSLDYEQYRFAYRLGYETRVRYPHLREEEALSALHAVYEREADAGNLPWARARYAARAAWHRADAHMRQNPQLDRGVPP
ncbi:MAG: hypothetical protein AB7F78_26440 [Hyphomicrobiaceae bacterium]